MNFIINFFVAAVLMGTTLMYGTLGEILTEKSGNMNLGVEGLVYMGGSSGLIAAFLYERAAGEGAVPMVAVILAFVAAFLAAALGSLLYAFLTITLRTNQNVTGLALTIFGVGYGEFFGEYFRQIGDQDAHYIMEALPNEMDAPNELAWLEDIAPYIYHCHAKCLHMNENCEDDRIDAAGAVKMLKKIGYDGYLSTEYEGQRSAPGAEDDAADELIDEIEQVRRHQVMLHRLIAEA